MKITLLSLVLATLVCITVTKSPDKNNLWKEGLLLRFCFRLWRKAAQSSVCASEKLQQLLVHMMWIRKQGAGGRYNLQISTLRDMQISFHQTGSKNNCYKLGTKYSKHKSLEDFENSSHNTLPLGPKAQNHFIMQNTELS